MPVEGENVQSIKAQVSKLAALLESAIDGIITISETGNIDSVNSAALRLFQYSETELLGQNIMLLMPEPAKANHNGYLAKYLKTGDKKIIGIGREVTALRKDGTTFPAHLSISEYTVDGTVYFTGIIHDLTRRKHDEDTLRHAQKMEAIGQLTGGIAHDFNNLLTVIVGNLELLEMGLENENQLNLLNEAQEAAGLGAGLTQRLLAFARRSHLEPVVVNLNTLVLGLTDILHRTLGEHVDLSTALSTDLWSTKVDRSQVENAIVNLAVNARDAITSGGKLILETRNTVIDEEYIATEADLTRGEYVQLTVSDNGTGMPASVRERAFEPFFTTKDPGRGTGLGLSMIYGFAKQSGGHVTIYSEVGLGTTVNLYLPRHNSEAIVSHDIVVRDEIEPARGELILVVEDDDRVRRLALTRLKQLGYNVLAAVNGREALEIFKKNEAIDLVFTDLIMPGNISGYELCAMVRRLDPDMSVLLTSGYAEELVHGDKLAAENLTVLRKPYRQQELARAIRTAFRKH